MLTYSGACLFTFPRVVAVTTALTLTPTMMMTVAVMIVATVRCGRRKCVDFLVTQMGANVEIPDEGGFTPLLNTGGMRRFVLLPARKRKGYPRKPVGRKLRNRAKHTGTRTYKINISISTLTLPLCTCAIACACVYLELLLHHM